MLSAGFDKDAEAIVPLLAAGFGAVEIGSVTPEPQSGNPKPRVFRLLEDSGVINRYGFNSSGHSAVKSNLKSSLHSLSLIRSYNSLVSGSEGSIGVNLGKNTLSPSAVLDYTRGIRSLGPLSSYIVINVSCPNINNLTKLQDDLKPLLDECCKVRDDVCERKMIFVKVGPDLNDEGIKKISEGEEHGNVYILLIVFILILTTSHNLIPLISYNKLRRRRYNRLKHILLSPINLKITPLKRKRWSIRNTN